MKTVKKQAAQGDVLFVRVTSVPTSAQKQEMRGPIVVAHSETGHHHTVESPGAEYFVEPKDPFTCYLQLATDSQVVHHRPFDTHESFTLGAGLWMVRRQREWTPEGYRRVED